MPIEEIMSFCIKVLQISPDARTGIDRSTSRKTAACLGFCILFVWLWWQLEQIWKSYPVS